MYARAWWKKGVSDDYKLKIYISAIQLNIGAQAGFRVRNIFLHLFLDLRASI